MAESTEVARGSRARMRVRAAVRAISFPSRSRGSLVSEARESERWRGRYRVPAARGFALVAAIALTVLSALPVSAQYFGRNKVQYDDFDWQVMATENFDIHFYPEARLATEDGARMVERWNARLKDAFQHRLRGRKPIVYYADHPDFQQTNVISGLIGEGTGGVTEALKNRMTLPFTGVYEDNDHVIGHELVHVYQYDIASRGGMAGLSQMGRLPLWLVEGMAEYLSTGREDAHTAMWMRDAVLRDDVPTIRQLTRDRRYFPYRYGQALLAYVAGLYGDGAVTALFRSSLRNGWDGAVRGVLGMTSDSLSRQWISATRAAYLPTMEGRTIPDEVGRVVLSEDLDAGSMNVAPSLSPDGRYVAFYSELDLFSVDLFIADAQTGEVLHKVASADSDPHFDALSFLQSAGTWSPDGQRLAFVVFSQGDNELAIAEVEDGDIEQRIAVRGVGAIRDPAWSPDGRTIAFTGLSGGISDLYLLDIASGQVRQLTNDRYADIQAAWSPDGRTIAFASDRGTETDFARLVYSPMRVTLIEVATGATEVLPVLDERAKHMNPQWSPDGTELYFVADVDGFSDVFRTNPATGATYRVTNVATGVSGVTDLSPALTVAARTGTVMFTVFGDGEFTVHSLTPELAVGTPIEGVTPGISVARVLPPVESAGRGLVGSYLDDPLAGLPDATEFVVADYESNLTLDYIGTPAVGAIYSPGYGSGFVGGVSFLFSDMLGNRQVGAVLQAQGGIEDIGGQAVYIDAGDRWNWGVGLTHIPYASIYGQRGVTDSRVIDRIVRERFYVSEAGVFAQYPFTMTRRFEADLSYTRYAFDIEEELLEFDRQTGQLISRTENDLNAAPDVHMVSSSPAYVGDNSFFGFTSPVSGGRFRYEVSPTVGTLNFVTLNLDHRRYFFFNPLTLAVRGMHFGYYTGDESDTRLRDGVFLGYEWLIRGYARESFESNECPESVGSGTFSDCPAFGRLYGSRIAVANFEARFPFLGVEEFGLINFPYLPTELTAFFDAGFAWCGDSPPETPEQDFVVPTRCGPGANGEPAEDTDLMFRTNSIERIPVFSAGVSSRFNILGYIILEVYYAYPFQRPDKGWHLGFNLAPGW
ncbi:MAG TPA: basic secretory protein-like protein [Longimicrobiales bacterium]|nr:basic secretory protein-like protein [Longimicrobiales bacterium]